MNILVGILLAIGDAMYEASPYLILGLAVAVVMKRFVRESAIARHLGNNSFSNVVKAALFGIPLPLCSCSVVPAAVELRNKGASPAATTAFLVSTPESGIDSILLSYGLLGGVIAIARIISAFVIAIAAGAAELLRTRGDTPSQAGESSVKKFTLGQSISYVINSLFQEMNIALVIAFVASGVIVYTLPSHLIENYFGGNVFGMISVFVLSIPLYVCASSSTPVARAMLLKGMSPGTALVFLLGGPATNLTSLSILRHALGKRAFLFYVITVFFGALACGLLFDIVIVRVGIQMILPLGYEHNKELSPIIHYVSVAILIMLLLRSFYRDIQRVFFSSGHRLTITLPPKQQ